MKLLVKARRIGGSFACGLEAALAAAGFVRDKRLRLRYRPDRGVNQTIVSAGHSQAKLLLSYVAQHLQALEVAGGVQILDGDPGTEKVRLRNGVECVALAANPNTIRGYTGDLTLDEFGSMPRSREIWAAAKSVTDAHLGRPYGYRLRVIGTPLGDDNLFHDLACTEAGKRFSRHFVDVHAAIKDGFPANVEALREEAGDADIFAQEYECAFLSAADRYISAAIWDAAVYTSGERSSSIGHGYAGMDVARKSTGDLSAICELRRVDRVLWQDDPVRVMRGASWERQEAEVDDTLSRCQRIAVDGTGLGQKFGEDLVRRLGASRVESVEFTTKSKEALATGLRKGLEDKRIRPMEGDAELRRDVLNLRRTITSAGNVRYDAERRKDTDGKASHADRAWALALAAHAAGRPVADHVGRRVGPSEGSRVTSGW